MQVISQPRGESYCTANQTHCVCMCACVCVCGKLLCAGRYPPGALLRHRGRAAQRGGLRRRDQRGPVHHREPGYSRPTLQVPAARRRRQGIHRAQVGGGGSSDARLHALCHPIHRGAVSQGENGVACKLDSRGYKALIQATTSVLGDAKPYAIGGSLPLIRSLQESGFDVQISGYGASAK